MATHHSLGFFAQTSQKIYCRFGVRDPRYMTKEEIDHHLKRETAEREAKKHEAIRKEQENRALYQQLKVKYGEEQEHSQ
jgi:hypothetical protein